MKNLKDYINQIKLEIKKTLGSKMMIIFMALLLLLSIAVPIISTFDWFGPRYYYGGYGEGELEVDGVIIEEDSIFYWDIFQFVNNKQNLSNNATSSNDDLALELVEIMLEDYVQLANSIKDYEDYRTDVVWSRRQNFATIFILEHLDVPADEMQQILEMSNSYYRDLSTLKEEYYELSDEKKQEKLDDANEALELSNKIILYGDHQAYFDYMVMQAENNLKANQQEIERLEQSIIEDPSNEEIFDEQIENIKRVWRLMI